MSVRGDLGSSCHELTRLSVLCTNILSPKNRTRGPNVHAGMKVAWQAGKQQWPGRSVCSVQGTACMGPLRLCRPQAMTAGVAVCCLQGQSGTGEEPALPTEQVTQQGCTLPGPHLCRVHYRHSCSTKCLRNINVVLSPGSLRRPVSPASC